MINPLTGPNRAAVLFAASTVAIYAPAQAQAPEPARAFQIPAQGLASALIVYSRQSDVLVIVDSELVRGKNAPAVQGSFTPSEALQRLLEGSGLTPQQRTDGGIVLAASDNASPNRPGAADQAAPGAGRGAGEGRNLGTSIEEVIVTAERRDEGLQSVPVAVTALTRELRDTLGLNSEQEVFNFTPGVSYGGNDQLAIRGIGRQTQSIGTDPGVAVYSNGFYGVSNAEVGISPILTERVEVLRGPQGTLYGRNSIGGAVNVISRRPSKQTEAEFRVIAGDYDLTQFEFRVAGSLTDHLRGSVGGIRTDQREGYFTNTAGGHSEGGVEELTFGDVQLQFDAGPKFDGWFRWYGGENPQKLRSRAMVSPYATSTPIQGLTINPAFAATATNPATQDVRKFAADTPAKQTMDDVHFMVLELTGRLPGMQLRYLGGYSQYDLWVQSDADGTPFATATIPFIGTFSTQQVQYITDEKATWSHELTLTSTHEGPLQWLAGLYYFHENQDQSYDVTVPGQPQYYTPYLPAPFPPPPSPFAAPAPPNPNASAINGVSSLETASRAVYGQLDYHPLEDWSFTLGLRYSEDEKRGADTLRIIFFDPFSNPAVPIALDPLFGPFSRQLEDEWDGVTGTVGTQWSPTRDLLGYVKYSRGFKSGGMNLGTGDVSPYVDEETVDAYELGWKHTIGARLRFNGALFYNVYEGAQAPVQVPIGGTATEAIATLVNLDQARTLGFELETTWVPLDNLRVLLNYSYLDAEIEAACCFVDSADPTATQPGARPIGGGAQDLAGNTTPLSPRHKVAANLSYVFDLAASELTLSATHTWQDETYYSIFNTPDWLAPDYHQTNFRATWRQHNGPWVLVASLNNAFDEDAIVDVDTNGPPSRYRTIGPLPPRIWALEARLEF